MPSASVVPPPSTSSSPRLGRVLFCFVIGLPSVWVAQPLFAVPLTFDTMVGAPDGNSLLGPVATSDTLFFTGVATDNGATIDARVTATVTGDANFGSLSDPDARNYFGDAGYLPNFHSGSGGPENDLGFLYYGTGIDAAEDGVSLTIDFFNGTGDQSGSFTQKQTVSALELAIYDVDGEASQSEYFTAFKSDGLIGYLLGDTPQALSATDLGTSVLFEGVGTNFSETDASGAAVLLYELTETLRLDFGSVQTSGPYQNGVFSAIDGDVSLFALNDFGTPQEVNAVPLPPSLILGAAGLTSFVLLSKLKYSVRKRRLARRHARILRRRHRCNRRKSSFAVC